MAHTCQDTEAFARYCAKAKAILPAVWALLQAHNHRPIRFLTEHSYVIGNRAWYSVDAILDLGNLRDGTNDIAVGDEVLAQNALYPMEMHEGSHGERYVKLRSS